MNGFRELNQLPVPLKFGKEIDVGQLVTHKAKWHKSCHLKFSESKLGRARKQEHDDSIGDDRPLQKLPRLQRQPLDKNKCIFCTKETGRLHEFRTLDADSNVRTMARDLQDTALLTKIDGGDLTALEAKYHLACLTGIRNKHRSFLRQSQQGSNIN